MDSDPVCPEWFNPDPVCPERMDPVNSIKFDLKKNPLIIGKFSNSRISIIHKYLIDFINDKSRMSKSISNVN